MKNSYAFVKYSEAVKELQHFCEDNTDLNFVILDERYPFTIQFVPNMQIDLFVNNENINENGEINDMTVTVGLDTVVNSNLKFSMDAAMLKKIIRMVEKIGNLYYHSYRAQADFKDSGIES